MNRSDSVIRIFFFIAGFPFLYYIFAQKQPDWLYYTSLSMVFIGLIYNLISDWRKGKKDLVKKRLKIYGVLVGVCLLAALMLK